jgi:hypothetical protein
MSGGPFSILGGGVDYMDAMANPDLARQYAAQPQGILGGLDRFAQENGASLMGMAAGLLSGDGWGAGLNGFARGMEQDERTRLIQRRQAEEEQKRVAATQLAQQMKLPPALASDPDAVFAMARQVEMQKRTPKEYSLQDQWLRDKAKQDPAFLDTYFGSQLGPKPTDDLREYQVAKSQGYEGSFIDYQKELKKAGAQSISIDSRAESTETVEKAREDVKYLSGLAAEAPKVAQRSADLNFLGGIVAKTPTGSGAELRAQLDGIGSKLGMSPGTLKSQADAIKAVTNRLAPSLRAPGSGSQSDAELAGFLAALPNLAADPKANQLIQASLQRAAAIDRQRTQVASQYRAGRITRQEAMGKLADIDEQSIYASPEEKKIVENIMGGQPLSGGDQSGNWKILEVFN